MIAGLEAAAALGVTEVLMVRPEQGGGAWLVSQTGQVMQCSTGCDHDDGAFVHGLRPMSGHVKCLFHARSTEFRVLRWAA